MCSRAFFSAGSRTVAAKDSMRMEALISVCTAMSQIGSEVMRESVSGSSFGQFSTAGL
jgi:hypothetical protein